MPLPATRGTDSNFFTQVPPSTAVMVQQAAAPIALPFLAQLQVGWGKVINDLYVKMLGRNVTEQEMYAWADKFKAGTATPATIAEALRVQANVIGRGTGGPPPGMNTAQPGTGGTTNEPGQWFQGVFYPASGPGPPKPGPPIEQTPFSPPSPTPPNQQASPTVPNPWTINPAVWDSLGDTGQQLALGFAEKAGWNANDYTRQINATRPMGTVPRTSLTQWERPSSPWST